jgi:signal transduction histidine kinase
MDATAAREAELVNQALQEAVLLLQRQCEEHGKVERELRQTCENLRCLLIEKTSQLQQEIEKRKAIEEILRTEPKTRDGERLAAWGATAALFTHEVANSLNGISASLQLLDMKAQEQNLSDPDEESLLGSAKAEIKRLGFLLQDFRSFVRPQKYDFEPTNLRAVINEAVTTEKLLYDSMGIRVRFDFSDSLPPVSVDRDKIQHAILCICKNAVEAMPSGGVLTFRGYESDGAVFLEIGDTGAGIPKGLEVFEPFQTTKPLGSGLGLAVVSQIISAHNGTIDYMSEPGRGTTFKIGLPAKRV